MNTEELRRVAEAATPLDFDSAEIKRRVGEVVECPHCQGEGSVELDADYCNFDGTAIGVEFYGIGMAHGAAEAFVRAFNPKTAIALLDRIAALEAENVELREALEKQKWNTELLRRAAGYVQDASTRYYDGTDGASIRLGAKALALAIDAALKETP